jgi:hypothetical protein
MVRANRSPARTATGGVALIATLALALAACGPTVVAPPANPVHPRAVSTNPDDRTPHILDGQVYAVIDLGNRVIVGGEFTRVKRFNQPAVSTRRGIFAFDKATGAIDTGFAPALDRGGVRDMVVTSDGRLIIGGSFQTVNGRPYVGLAKIDLTTGATDTGFKGTTNGWVNTMALRGERLFIGGTFTTVGATARIRLAAVRATTGGVDAGFNVPVEQALRGAPNVWRLDATRNGSKLVITGNFTRVGGQPRTQVAIVDVGASSARVSTWATSGYRAGVCSPNVDYYVKDVDIAPDDSFFAIVTTGAWGGGLATLCDTVARWEMGRTGGDQRHTWADWTGGDSLSAVAVTGPVVYAAGHQRWANNENAPRGDAKGPGAVDRPGIAAYRSSNGSVLPFAPDRERGLQVGTMTPTDKGLWIGSDSSRIGGEWHPRLAFLPLQATGAGATRAEAG